MSDENNKITNTTNHIHEAKSDARYLKLEILQLAAEFESTTAQATGNPTKLTDILKTADKLADFVFAEEENIV